jgi:hypothetical protein
MLLAKLLEAHSPATAGNTSNTCQSSSSSSSSSANSSTVLNWRTVKVLKELEPALLKFAAAQQPTAAARQTQSQLEWAVQQLLPGDTYTLQQVGTPGCSTSAVKVIALGCSAVQCSATVFRTWCIHLTLR